MTALAPVSAMAPRSRPTSVRRHARLELAVVVVLAAALVVGVLLADARGVLPVSRSVPAVVALAVVVGVVALRGVEDLGVGLLLLAALTLTRLATAFPRRPDSLTRQ